MNWKQRVKWTQTVAFCFGIRRRPAICGAGNTTVTAIILPFGSLQEESR